MNIVEKVKQFEVLNMEIRAFLYPILYKLYDEKKLNAGDLPSYKPAKDAVHINEFRVDGNDIYVLFDIHWRGDNYEESSIILTEVELNNL